MKPEDIDFSSTADQNPVASVGFFVWIWSKFQALAAWFYPNTEEYPPDEAGLLMQRHMEQKSWFDKISSSWNEQSFLLKLTYASLFILASSFVGILMGASLTLTLSAAILSILTHKLLVSHEQNRWAAARIFAAETIALNTDLHATEVFFNEATHAMSTTHEALRTEVGTMKAQVERLEPEIPLLQQQREALAYVVDKAENATTNLLHQEKSVYKEFAAISEDLDIYHKKITHSKEVVATLGEVASQFSGVVTAMQGSQLKFAEAVDTICFFANERSRSETTEIENNNDFIAELMRQVAINEAFIEKLSAPNPLGQTVH
jgi:hypothetical protein